MTEKYSLIAAIACKSCYEARAKMLQPFDSVTAISNAISLLNANQQRNLALSMLERDNEVDAIRECNDCNFDRRRIEKFLKNKYQEVEVKKIP